MISELFSENAFLWTCIWQSTACMAAGLASSFFLRRRPARAHQVLLLAMIAAVIVPIMSALVEHYELGVFVAEPIQSEVVGELAKTQYETPKTTAIEYMEDKASLAEQDFPPATVDVGIVRIAWWRAVYWGWLAASLILAVRLVVTFVLGVRLLGWAIPLDCERIEQAVHLVRAKLGIDKDVKACCSQGVHSPVIWCWRRRPVLLVPGAQPDYSTMELTGSECFVMSWRTINAGIILADYWQSWRCVFCL